MTNFSKILFHLARIFPSMFNDQNSETEVIDSLESISSIDQKIEQAKTDMQTAFDKKVAEITQKHDELIKANNDLIEANRLLTEENTNLGTANDVLVEQVKAANSSNQQVLTELANIKQSIGQINTGKQNENFKEKTSKEGTSRFSMEFHVPKARIM